MPWWWYFQPAFNCPHDVERIGRINDGGKWMCGMSVLERPSKKCVIYSLGIFDDSSFEAAMLERTDCEIWAFDASVNGVAGGMLFLFVFVLVLLSMHLFMSYY